MKARRAILLSGMATLIMVMASCANIVRPTGGEKDTEGPVAIHVEPDHLSLNFDAKQITFDFNEYLKPGGYGEEIFVSPVMKTPPDVLVSGKKLIVKFREPLRPNTTYVINLGTGIKDNTEANEMKEPVVYAFSTGDKLDTLRVGGQATDDMGNAPVEGMTVLLYEADSVQGNDIKGKVPSYAAMVQPGGAFELNYLKPGRYKIYAVKDLDKSYSWSQNKEAVALPNQPEFTIDSLTKVSNLTLTAFLMDEERPAVKSAKWMDAHNILVEFKEPVRKGFKADSLSISMADTLGKEEVPVTQWELVQGKPHQILLHASRPQTAFSRLVFHNLMDTLGNRGDTFDVVTPASTLKLDKEDIRFFANPVVVAHERTVLLQAQMALPASLPDTAVQVVDTTGKALKANVTSTAYTIQVKFSEWPDTKMPLRLRVMPALQLADTVTDTALVWKLPIPKQEEFGSVSGILVFSAVDSLTGHPWVAQLYLEGGKGPVLVRRTPSGSTKFKFDYLKPGLYSIKLVQDLDGNGYYTPGSLTQGRMPERVVAVPEKIEIKAKWDIEDFKASTTSAPRTRAVKTANEEEEGGGAKGRKPLKRGKGK